jgi:hypothetical protein
MDNVILFPGTNNPEIEPVAPAESMRTTEGYSAHQQELKDWLFALSNYDVAGRNTFLNTINERYGSPQLSEDEQEQLAREAIYDDSRSVSYQLQYSHIRSVIVSPVLSILQKADLLTISADYLYNTNIPEDGGRVILKDIQRVSKKMAKVFNKNDDLEQKKQADLTEHLESLSGLISETFPRLSRVEFYKKAATTISGESVTNIFRALGIYCAELDNPTPQEVEIAKAQDGPRLLRDRARAERELVEVAKRLSEVEEVKK